MSMKGKGRWILLALVIGGAAWWFLAGRPSDGQGGALFGDGPRRAERIVPEGVRIRVEVLNATTIRGLARQGTFHLRDLGFDVVASGNSAERHDSSVVLVRSGNMEWGALAARALGGARVEARPDSSRYLDLTIVLGRTWRPPAEAFHP